MIAEVYNLNSEELSDSFAENCNAVSYGDSDFTLVNQTDYISILFDAISAINEDTVLDFDEAKKILHHEITQSLEVAAATEKFLNSFYINLEA
jgi:hypothetical protein